MQFEKEIENYLVKRVKELGGICWKFSSPGTAGVPDRIVMYQSCVTFVELKRPDGHLSEIQKKRLKELDDQKILAQVVSSKEEVDRVIEQLIMSNRLGDFVLKGFLNDL